MKFTTLFVCGAVLAGCMAKRTSNIKDASSVRQGGDESFSLSSAVYSTSAPFVAHDSGQPYLAREVNYQPIADLRADLEPSLQVPIKNRGEAHITTIAPTEFSASLRQVLSMAQIDQIAAEHHIQQIPFEAVCIGEGRATIKGNVESTYYIVVKSPGLVALRQAVQDAYTAAGGGDEFDARNFNPHITIGFTKRDLFPEDGVIKDESSCIYPLTIK